MRSTGFWTIAVLFVCVVLELWGEWAQDVVYSSKAIAVGMYTCSSTIGIGKFGPNDTILYPLSHGYCQDKMVSSGQSINEFVHSICDIGTELSDSSSSVRSAVFTSVVGPGICNKGYGFGDTLAHSRQSPLLIAWLTMLCTASAGVLGWFIACAAGNRRVSYWARVVASIFTMVSGIFGVAYYTVYTTFSWLGMWRLVTVFGFAATQLVWCVASFRQQTCSGNAAGSSENDVLLPK